jgi:hypothetical protein
MARRTRALPALAPPGRRREHVDHLALSTLAFGAEYSHINYLDKYFF